MFEAIAIIKKEKPDIVFSKGGFVSVPVVMAAYFSKVPVISHESDMTPGLANRICIPYSTKLCVTFPEAINNIKGHKAVLTGTPIREELYNGSKLMGLKICGFKDSKPVLLIIGGSLGSKYINDIIRENIDLLLVKYNIIHICGKNNIDISLGEKTSYKQFEYISKDMPHIMNSADIVISRAGANSIFELLALKKPNILIPLSKNVSRGDQILNAKSFLKSGYSIVIEEEELTSEILLNKLQELYYNRNLYISNMTRSSIQNGVNNIIDLILENCKKK